MKNDVKFKDTVMGKITKGAIISWGENDEKGDWFQPTEEQAEQMLTEGGLQLGEKRIDYSSSEKATNEKTYGSEIAAINGLVELISKQKEISEEEKKALSDQIKTEIYTEEHLSPEIEEKAKGTIFLDGISDYKHDSYRNEISTPKDAKSDYAWHYERKISERKIKGKENGSNKKGIIQFGFDESAKKMDGDIKTSESELLRAGLDPEKMGCD